MSLPACCESIRFAACLIWLISCGVMAQEAAIGLQRDVIFGESLPLADRPAGGQPIRLAEERFILYVPSIEPPAGYGLLVFVPPWQEAKLPPGWEQPLDRAGMIFVAAARSGNRELTSARREPLALLAAYNVARRYQVDPARIYVGGFSGGSRVALRLALYYPTIFRGALLNSGSDSIGDAGMPPPPPDLLPSLRKLTRLVFINGEHDAINRAAAMGTIVSLRPFCVRTDSQIMPWKGHAVMDASALAEALTALDHPPETDCPP